MQEGIAGPIGKLYKSKSLVGIVPFDYGLDRGTGGRLKPLGAKFRCRSETAPGCFEVVVVEATVTGRAKISLSAAHVIPWGIWNAPTLKWGGMIVNEFYTAGDRQGGSVIKVADLVEGGRHAERRSHPTGLAYAR
jgi:hypothetical protein